MLKWLDVNAAEWTDSTSLSGDQVTLTAPGAGQWVAVVVPARSTVLVFEEKK